jgi:exosortase A-associated hydrolase 1
MNRAVIETPLVFTLGADALVGVLSAPDGPASETGLLVVVGGPQVRMGSHRQFVQLTRHLAAHGIAAMRFDVRGMGDSSGEAAGFERLHEDIEAAVSELMRRRPEVKRVALWGLCDGASACLLYLQRKPDARIAGLALLNPWVRSEQTLARARVRHYYWHRLMQPGFWRKLLSGSVGRAAMRDWLRNWRTARADAAATVSELPTVNTPFPQRMAQGWRACHGPILLVLSGDDVTAQEFAVHADSDASWRGALRSPRVTRADLPEADHTFSVAGSGERVAQLTLDWLRSFGQRGA